jgi:hypothetical protein
MLLKSALFMIIMIGFSINTEAQLSLDIETGTFLVNRNDASSSWKNSFGELNGTEGTLFSYAKDFNNPLKPLIRIRTNYAFGTNNKHIISFLAAPLEYTTSGTLNNPITFNSVVFDAQKETQGFYKFNGYRLTYRYQWLQSEKITLGLGLTLNYRDAAFSLKQENLYERNYNRGFVPLINTYTRIQLKEKLSILIDGDVFYIDKTGGAIDYLTGFQFNVGKQLHIKTGYRFFSGVGSEVGNVYNKLFVSSYVLGAIYQW